jgi:hypothetical protein
MVSGSLRVRDGEDRFASLVFDPSYFYAIVADFRTRVRTSSPNQVFRF